MNITTASVAVSATEVPGWPGYFVEAYTERPGFAR